jgi:hypothetical protein
MDWCTAWPERWGHIDWSPCCKEHDEDYSKIKKLTGWKNLFKRIWLRRKADYKLGRCVWDKGLPPMGVIMFFGVRLFGWIPLYFKKRSEQ